ncbi:MAG: tRNA (cytidine(56)-2'-O)-methyltransferase [Thermoplasmataceae archaeon]
MPENRIEVLRINHRPFRDKRVTTHVALTARAFGADSIIVDEEDKELEEVVNSVVKRFGGSFQIKTGVAWEEILKNYNGVRIHLTMYGQRLADVAEKLRKIHQTSNILIIVGASKVPPEVYQKSEFNVSVTNQPISEISALALLLDRIMDGAELSRNFDGKYRIIPQERGKSVIYIPDEAECMKILLSEGANQRIIDHVKVVESVAVEFAKHAGADVNLVRAAALLHDIGRTKTNGIDHAYMGYLILKDKGLDPRIPEIVRKHTGAGITQDEAKRLGLPDLDYIPSSVEEMIVAHADNLVHGTRVSDIDETISDYLKKGLIEPARRLRELEEKLTAILGEKPSELARKALRKD